jgi:tubulin delta
MQAINSVLALSFLQAYSDVVMLYDNQEMIDACSGRGARWGHV